ncbi:related to alcohol dehydrogenase [Rhynchosporium agropyri]|uniref:Related to alcohol dehydrogenase n=1 Tax=Rhynchosporium agropyri TaxID=914238 RepID=A0A1E1K8R9_9HELO|nr:related to alcohol dehydrogenase [Rhynchosporium agropyri]
MAPQIPEKMLAAQVVEFEKPYKIHEIETPGKDLNEHDMLVKVAVGSLCHTDGMVSKGIMGTKLPCVASHEGAGTVVQVGSRVNDFKAGDRVLCSLTYHRCGECADCKGPEQDRQYCANVGGYLGVTIDGSFAEYEVVDGRERCLLPDNLSFQSAAPLACAGVTVWGGLVRSGLKSGETVALVGGGGGLGHLGVQFAIALGLKVIAIDARDEGLSLAKECGADFIIDARQDKESIVNEVKKANSGKLADATLNVSDHESAATTSAAITKMHGVLVQIAQPTNVSVPFAELIFRDIRIHGSLTSRLRKPIPRDQALTTIRFSRRMSEMLKIASENKISVRTNPFYGIKEIPKAVELAHSGQMQGKPVIIIDNGAIENERKSGLEMV